MARAAGDRLETDEHESSENESDGATGDAPQPPDDGAVEDDVKPVLHRAATAVLDEERHPFASSMQPPSHPHKVLQWRMKGRMRTVSVALVACLNIGVNPPDVVKTQPCARLECWIDPLALPPQKALGTIGNRLQLQYERWQPRSLDQTVEDIRKLCISFRRSSKKERVLFHYNGHGVPRPTSNGEIWVFNKTWMSSPSIYVFDCSCAGLILDSYVQFAIQRQTDSVFATSSEDGGEQRPSLLQDSILLAACAANQLLPMNPEFPADIFTACLTTPIKMALRWFAMRSVLSGTSRDKISKIPGRPNDRKTPLGELNWIFTAITDTIAWNVLPQDLFQRLFRQDLLVASLFRNFLLAERIMHSVNCTPLSVPALPSTRKHEMWEAWDLAAEYCLSQLGRFLKDPSTEFKPSTFFSEQLTAFEVWLEFGTEEKKPMQLPVVLQVLLSQAHRLRALKLLARFLDKGHWAVNLALSVGIFPYVLKLLQSPTVELREVLVFIWAKILSLDKSCQSELVKDLYHSYFVKHFCTSRGLSSLQTLLCTFVLTVLCDSHPPGQKAVFHSEALRSLTENLHHSSFRVRQWTCLCFGKLLEHNNDVKAKMLHFSVLSDLNNIALSDPVPDVRAAATFALGKMFGSSSETQRSAELELAKLLSPLVFDASPLVRIELVLALSALVLSQSSEFVRFGIGATVVPSATTSPPRGSPTTNDDHELRSFIWKVVRTLCKDPFKEVAGAAGALVKRISPAYNYVKVIEDPDRHQQDQQEHSKQHADLDSGLYQWCFSMFATPIHDLEEADDVCVTGAETSALALDIPRQQWRYQQHQQTKLQAEALQSRKAGQLDHQVATLQTPFTQTWQVLFHPYEPILVATDAQRIRLWNYSTGLEANTFPNLNDGASHINSISFLNEEQVSLLAVASDDGVVRVWKNSHLNGQQKMVTSWVALPSLKRRPPGLIMSWQQRSKRLVTTGNSELARIWDLEIEACVLDLPVGTSSCVTCLSMSEQNDVIYIGCGDRGLRMLDLRDSSRRPVVKLHSHRGWVVNVNKQKRSSSPLLYSCSIDGDVLSWDPRMPRSHIRLASYSSKSAVEEPISAVVFHDHASLVAVGSLRQFVKVFDGSMEMLNTIRYHDGFLGQRIAAVNCLAFHPYRPLLACGFRDKYVSILADTPTL